MDSPMRVLQKTARSIWEDMFTLVLASAIWAVIGLVPPLFLLPLGSPLILGIALLITVPPVTAGLFYVTNRLAHGLVGKLSHVFEGMRRYARPAWILALINAFVAALAAANFQFYGQFDAPWVVFVRALWVALLMIWISSQVYAFPMLLEQEKPNIVYAIRNSLFLAFGSPALSITIVLLLILVAGIILVFLERVLSFLPLLLLLPAILALLTNVAVVQRLKAIRGQPDNELDT